MFFATGVNEHDPWLSLHPMMATDPIPETLCSGKQKTINSVKITIFCFVTSPSSNILSYNTFWQLGSETVCSRPLDVGWNIISKDSSIGIATRYGPEGLEIE